MLGQNKVFTLDEDIPPYLEMNYYVQQIGGLGFNGIKLKGIIGTHGN